MFGILDLSLWGHVIAAILMTHVTIASVTIFLHRHQAHRALDLNPVVSHLFRLWLWLSTGMITKNWTAIHRKHHAKCETKDDPHSPQVLGLKKVLTEGAELYREEGKNKETLEKYGHGTPDDWLERNIYGKCSRCGVAVMFVIDIALFGIGGITLWAVQMLWIPFFAAGVVNGIGHYFGYRNYETQDAATNILPWGILIGGEELHNNHHAFPSSAKLSSKWWEFDIGWFYIRVLEILKLAKVKKVAPAPVLVSGKQKVDMETVKAVVAYRFHVLSHYCRDVIVPVLQDEARNRDSIDRSLLRRARTLLVRDESLIDAVNKNRLQDMLRDNQTLHTVYEFKLRLQEIWKRSPGSPDTLVLLHALQEWCKQAEATGIRYLRDFAASLRSYTLSPNATA